MSSERRKPYPFDQIEPKWQASGKSQTFHAPNPGEQGFDPAKPKYYVLDMFPYPSGAGLHVGHPEGYTATDILARYRRCAGSMCCIRWAGTPSVCPRNNTPSRPASIRARPREANIAKFKRQIQALGFSYDWTREVDTTDPKYFRWTQWIFLKLYNSWFNPETNRAEPISALLLGPIRTAIDSLTWRKSQ